MVENQLTREEAIAAVGESLVEAVEIKMAIQAEANSSEPPNHGRVEFSATKNNETNTIKVFVYVDKAISAQYEVADMLDILEDVDWVDAFYIVGEDTQPRRVCRSCGAVLNRKPFEKEVRFITRRTCGQSCDGDLRALMRDKG